MIGHGYQPILPAGTGVIVGRRGLMRVVTDDGPEKDPARTITVVDHRDETHQIKRFNVALPRPRE